MKNRLFTFVLLLALTFSVLSPMGTAQAKAADSASAAQDASPAGMLNPDGTLNLKAGVSGTLDLQGYGVQLDPLKGPVFTPAASVPAGTWAALGDGGGVIDGRVRTILVDGTDVYIGGSFSDAANIPEADYIVKWDGVNWSALSSDGHGNGALSNDVTSLAMIGTDLYAGGLFSTFNSSGQSIVGGAYIAKWDGSTWSALGNDGAGGSSLNSDVSSLAVNGTDLYVGGSFTDVKNGTTTLTAADYVAKWDGSSWSALGDNGSSNGSFAGGSYISSLAYNNGTLYVGGNFSNVNDGGIPQTAADKIAQWNGTHWSSLGSNGAGEGPIGGIVFTLTASGTDLYVGGQFTDVSDNGTPLTAGDWIVRWDGSNWHALGSNGLNNGSLNNYVNSILVSGKDVYVGGFFYNVNINGTPLPTADAIAKFDTLTGNWSAIGDDGTGNGVFSRSGSAILALALQNGTLLAGGSIYDPVDNGTPLLQGDFLVQWNGGHWSELSKDANGALVNGYSSSRVNVVLVDGTDVYVGGYFSNISNHGVNIPEADYLAKWDGVNWSAVGDGGSGYGSLDGPIYALAMIGTDLYVGGQFTNVREKGTTLSTADYVAKFDTLTGNWSALGDNGAGNGALPGGSVVIALASDGTDLYVGGGFSNVSNGGTPIPEADYLARWDTLTGTWSALGNNGAGNGALNGSVAALAVDASHNLYAGGYFTDAAGLAAADYIAKWDSANWSALGDNNAGDGSLNQGVQAIAISGTDVYAGGIFNNVNNHGTVLNAADLIAKWDGTDWSALGNNGMNDGIFCVGCGNRVNAIQVRGSDVYVGGYFTNLRINNVVTSAADYIAKWDGSTWAPLSDNGANNGSLNSNVFALAIQGTDLLVGGGFTNVNNGGTLIKEADYLAAYGMTGSTVDTTPPTVVSVKRASPNPTSAASVDFTVTFSENVYFPWPSVFTVTQVGVSGAVVTGWTGSGSVYTIHVSTGSGTGTIRLDVIDDDTIVDTAGNPLGGVGAGNGTYTSGEVYNVTDTSFPTVQSINRANPSPTLGPTVTFAVTFSEPVTGVDETDFVPTVSGLTGPVVNSIIGSGADYLVIVDAGTGSGTIRLDLVDDNTIFDLLSHSLGGSGAGNGNFNTGQSYSVRTTTFTDVPTNYWSWQFIERLFSADITGGCSTSPMMYCPETNVTRAQMAVFLLRGIHGSAYTPPTATGSMFGDVPAGYWAGAWIEQLAAEGITGGCGNGNYCPETVVTRDQMAVFLLRARHGGTYAPPTATGSMFGDVPLGYWADKWIEQLSVEGITGGCGGGNYCPSTPVSRAQMAVFLVRTFYLP